MSEGTACGTEMPSPVPSNLHLHSGELDQEQAVIGPSASKRPGFSEASKAGGTPGLQIGRHSMLTWQTPESKLDMLGFLTGT